MENLLLLLPKRPQGILARYGATTLIVLVCFALQMGVEFQSGMFMFFLLLPGIFLASVLFDRGSGFLRHCPEHRVVHCGGAPLRELVAAS
jgi:hypothetical protein